MRTIRLCAKEQYMPQSYLCYLILETNVMSSVLIGTDTWDLKQYHHIAPLDFKHYFDRYSIYLPSQHSLTLST